MVIRRSAEQSPQREAQKQQEQEKKTMSTAWPAAELPLRLVKDDWTKVSRRPSVDSRTQGLERKIREQWTQKTEEQQSLSGLSAS